MQAISLIKSARGEIDGLQLTYAAIGGLGDQHIIVGWRHSDFLKKSRLKLPFKKSRMAASGAHITTRAYEKQLDDSSDNIAMSYRRTNFVTSECCVEP